MMAKKNPFPRADIQLRVPDLSEPTYTKAEFAEFDTATLLNSSRDQVRRVEGRLTINRLVEKHGRAKCDAMFAEIERREAAKRRRR